MDVEQFEPVYLVPEGPGKLTEYGKRWMNAQLEAASRFADIIKDVKRLAKSELDNWPNLLKELEASGVPIATSGLSNVTAAKVIDHVNGKTSFTFPTTVALALGTAAPTSATTGVWGTTETTNYTGYARQAIANTGWVAATSAQPSIGASTGAITFPACTASTATYLGFLITDNATINSGAALWFGSLTSVTISTTQTPPTVASGALTVQIAQT